MKKMTLQSVKFAVDSPAFKNDYALPDPAFDLSRDEIAKMIRDIPHRRHVSPPAFVRPASVPKNDKFVMPAPEFAMAKATPKELFKSMLPGRVQRKR